MKVRRIAVVLLLILLSFSFISCTRSDVNKSNNQVSSAMKESLPIYFPTGEVKYYSRGDLVAGVSYSAKLPYSKQTAEVVLEFYDKKMKQLGFRPFVEDYYKYADRKWSNSFIDSTIKDNPNIVQLNASWADDTKSKRANLVLRYYWYVDNKQSSIVLGFNDDLKIDFQITPFIVFPPPRTVRN
jgi:hypothetical protein